MPVSENSRVTQKMERLLDNINKNDKSAIISKDIEDMINSLSKIKKFNID